MNEMQVILNDLNLVKQLAVIADEEKLRILVSDGKETADARDVLEMTKLNLHRPVYIDNVINSERLNQFIAGILLSEI